jgi:KUP system potassium uptake protein
MSQIAAADAAPLEVEPEETRTDPRLVGLTLAALGVVFGDIGTSPLYAIRECFHGPHGIHPTPANVLGVLSLIVWSLILVISIKYVLVVLRADNEGEGGILALMALVAPADGPGATRVQKAERAIIIVLGLVGAALLYGDGVITPAISVLSAVEGLEVATPALGPYVLPLTVAILIGLFMIQRFGTAKVGRVFGPIMVVWFLALAALGVGGIIRHPSVVQAVNPYEAVRFFAADPIASFLVLGAVFLVVTGGEALYADMGHFGRRPVRLAWLFLVLPCLLINYFGQGALLLDNPSVAVNPFYRLVPSALLYPMVALATCATVIASQALISGAFSLTQQAVQLGYLPRVEIRHTSEHERGQIYVPQMNWLLLVGTVWIVLEFRSSSALAAAYGIAVTMTMVITMCLVYFAMRRKWGWSFPLAGGITLFFLMIDLSFLGANLVKIKDGGWVPLAIAVCLYTVFATWRRGRKVLGDRLKEKTPPLAELFKELSKNPPSRVPGTAVYLSGNPWGTPPALARNLKHNKSLHETIIVLRVAVGRVPHIPDAARLDVEPLIHGFYTVTANYGFMQDANVPALLRIMKTMGVPIDLADVTYVLGRENVIATERPGMMIWREKLFAFLSRNAIRATAFFHIPADSVMEIGTEIEM